MTRGKRPSVAFGRKLPKRAHCTECGKKGVCETKAILGRLIRECQYCHSTFLVVGVETTSRVVYEVLSSTANIPKTTSKVKYRFGEPQFEITLRDKGTGTKKPQGPQP